MGCAAGDPLVGTSLGGYTIIRELGRGRAGVSYLAQHAATGLGVVMKLLHPNRALPAAARRLALEARYANELALESVVNVFDLGEGGPTGPYLVMEYLQGDTLSDLAAKRAPLPALVVLLSQVATVLEQAHRQGVVHAALGPHNVLRVEGTDLARLLPFGVPAGPASADEQPGDRDVSALGRPDFTAPEQARGAAPDPRMDVYSLGALAYLLTTGRVPQAEFAPEPPHRLNPRVSPTLSAVILRALEKSPEGRLPSAGEFAAALQASLADLGPEPDPAAAGVLTASVSTESGAPLGKFACSSVTGAGLVVCTTGPFPALMSAVWLTFPDLGGLTCAAQVVRHVTPEQATDWKMSPGYGVQFQAIAREQRARLEAAHHGVRAPTPSVEALGGDDPAAAVVLKRYTGERASRAYGLLGLSPGAQFDAIRERLREARRGLERLSALPLSASQEALREKARVRLDEVEGQLGDPHNRLEHDAAIGNFEGVARCINAGVPVSELEASRVDFLQAHPGAAEKSDASITAGEAFDARGETARALATYAEALRLDPLNLVAQQRYWAVLRRLGNG
jgi:eukaryotic-like serine/threonine-protein kinase